ncbi:TetR family transcriptional regulator [Gordonia sp. SL306]|uniref:acyl-CoA-like ligand-binding transcription factor n=1 Tax=Gordonia sp. SL306 TaxID=2995145 RepID=UPI002270B1BD|nr:TetR family transcriptional regulator [Gordonia sp. SL306]WAC53961.1 TetR family transcriptional regulator [Gordonia sp. SL306]
MSREVTPGDAGVSSEGEIDRGGRPASTSARELAAAAQRLFLGDGFDQTTVEDIAAAVGVSRRTFFRYFATKADVVWVESDAELRHFRAMIAESAPSANPVDVVEEAFIEALDHGIAEDEWARHRAQLILHAAAVQAQAGAVYRQWRTVIAEFVAERTGRRHDDEYPLAVAYAVMAASSAGHERWLADPDARLTECLRPMFALMVPRHPDVTTD